MDPVTLSDESLMLRLPTEPDVGAVTAACQDPETQRWIPVPVPYERRHAAEWIGTSEQSWLADRELRWLVTGADDGRVLGAMGFHVRDETMLEIGFWTAPWARRQGVTTSAARLACRWAFAALPVGRIEWWAAVGNDGSRRVVEKVGFTVEGTCRARIMHRGRRLDGWVGGLLPGEFR